MKKRRIVTMVVSLKDGYEMALERLDDWASGIKTDKIVDFHDNYGPALNIPFRTNAGFDSVIGREPTMWRSVLLEEMEH